MRGTIRSSVIDMVSLNYLPDAHKRTSIKLGPIKLKFRTRSRLKLKKFKLPADFETCGKPHSLGGGK